MATQSYKEVNAEDYIVDKEPFFMPTSDEVEVFQAAYNERVPILLKGPTGTGKTRFVEYMSWKINENKNKSKDIPLITVACHEDLTASDLVGRYLLDASGTRWIDGPLTRAVRYGGICYLDEIVEARQDTTVVIHSLTDDRRILPIEKTGEIIKAHKDFFLVISYNPGYQSVLKDLKESTKQRFASISFEYPNNQLEKDIIILESGTTKEIAEKLIKVSERTRNLKGKGLHEGASTRMLIAAAKLINSKLSFMEACLKAIVLPITDEQDVRDSLERAIRELG